MEKRLTKENFCYWSRRKIIVSREHLVAIIPPVRVLDGVRVDIPTTVVPVHVDRPEHTSVIIHGAIYITVR